MTSSTLPAGITAASLQQKLNKCLTAAHNAKLGDLLVNMITAINQVVTDHNALVTQYNLLLAHVDTGAVTGLGTANLATYPGTASVAASAKLGDL